MPMEKIASIHNKRRATAGNQRSILRFARPGSTRCMAANAMYVTKTGTSNDDTAIRPFSSTSVAVCRVTSVDPSGSNVPDVPWYVGASKNQTPTTQASPCAVHADTVVMRLAILGLLAVMGDNRHSANRAGRERLSHNVGPSASFRQKHGDSRILFVLSVKRDFWVTNYPACRLQERRREEGFRETPGCPAIWGSRAV